MTPREPDRFEAKAREIVDLFVTTGTHVTEMRSSLAVALRTAESSALERAAHRLEEIARDYEGRKLRSLATDETVEAAFLEQMGRAAWRCVKAVYELKSPAAAPAADRCACNAEHLLGVRSVYDEDGKYHSREGCADGSHRIATTSAPAPLLPRVLAALERDIWTDLAAELRAHIAATPAPSPGPWRVGRHYPIHLYAGDVPIATFFRAEDARRCVDAVNGAQGAEALLRECDDVLARVQGHGCPPSDESIAALRDKLRARVAPPEGEGK